MKILFDLDYLEKFVIIYYMSTFTSRVLRYWQGNNNYIKIVQYFKC